MNTQNPTLHPSHTSSPGTVTIQKGAILIYRVFDIAEEVNLSKVESIFKNQNEQSRLTLTRTPRQGVIMRNAPVILNLGESELNLLGERKLYQTSAKIWDYGVLSVMFQIPITEGTPFDQLTQVAAEIEASSQIDDHARIRAQELVNHVNAALIGPHYWHEFEDYVIYFFEKLEGLDQISDLPKRVEAARLIVAEDTVRLSDQTRYSILDGILQYAEDDLALIDWNSAIVVEPSGRKDVPEVLEFALTHMLEMRYYDSLLDQRLAMLYDAIEESRGKFFSNQFSKLSREASARYIEFSEFIERVENSIKVVGDFYLAKVFRTAGERYKIRDWEKNITRKINLFSELSNLLQGELNVKRSLWLEVTIVLLIAFEIISAFMQWGK